jgi:hypothetical protein
MGAHGNKPKDEDTDAAGQRENGGKLHLSTIQSFACRERNFDVEKAVKESYESEGLPVPAKPVGRRNHIRSNFWNSLTKEEQSEFRTRAENGEIIARQKTRRYVFSRKMPDTN